MKQIEDTQSSDTSLDTESGSHYLTNSSIGFTNEDFRFLLTSASTTRSYSCSPKHAKRIYLLLKKRVEEYEKKYGQLKTELPAAQKSRNETVTLGFKIQKRERTGLMARKRKTD